MVGLAIKRTRDIVCKGMLGSIGEKSNLRSERVKKSNIKSILVWTKMGNEIRSSLGDIDARTKTNCTFNRLWQRKP